MSDAARYRQKAREFEQRENWKRAIEAYELAVAEDKKARREVDVSLYNRLGDLFRRVGDVNKSVQYWEAAADGHISAGFYNNAIALCNKVLRNQPNRHSIYLKLGKIGAAKGFLSDARKHFLEYAERMQKANQLDEAFRALVEFSDLSPDPDVRVLIADQLLDHQRKDAAVHQLRLAWRDLGTEGREADAEQVRLRIIQLNPAQDPQVNPPEVGQASSFEDSMGIIDLPEIDPFPLVDPGGGTEATVEEPDLEPLFGPAPEPVTEPEPRVEEVAIDPTALVESEEEAAEETALGAEDLFGITPTPIADDSLDPQVEEPLALEEPPAEDPLFVDPTAVEAVEAQPAEEPPAAAADEASDSFLAALDPTSAPIEEPVPPITEPIETEELFIQPLITEPAEPQVDRAALLRSQLESKGRTPDLLGEYADALLEVGEREQATEALREALGLFEASDQFADAGRIVSELLRLDLNDLRAHQKRVELALQARDLPTLLDAYLDLADCLDRTDAGDRARAVFARVLELDPDNSRAHAALELLGDESVVPPIPTPPVSAAADDYIDLGSLVLDEEVKSTRFKVAASEPQSEGEVNFSDMLNQFKAKVAENIGEEDTASHYDLGIAYKEMGLLDEAIAEFQIAARNLDYRLRAIEMLGVCFLEKQEYGIGLKVLYRAAQGQYRDEELIGIFYNMGLAFQALGEGQRALESFERVMGCDMNFADVAQRVAALRT